MRLRQTAWTLCTCWASLSLSLSLSLCLSFSVSLTSLHLHPSPVNTLVVILFSVCRAKVRLNDMLDYLLTYKLKGEYCKHAEI